MKTRRSVILRCQRNFQERKKILHVTFHCTCLFTIPDNVPDVRAKEAVHKSDTLCVSSNTFPRLSQT